VKPPEKHYGLWLEWQRMLLNREVLEHTVIHHLLSIRGDVSHFSLFWFNFFARRFSNILEIRAVFNSSLLSSRLSFWFLFTENEYVSLCSIYVPPVMLLFLLDQGLWGPFFFQIFFHLTAAWAYIFSFRMESSGFLVAWWVSEGKEGGRSRLRPCFCLSACMLPG